MIVSIKETYTDFYHFVKNPIDEPAPIQTARHKINRLFSILAIEIPIIAVIGATIYGIEKLGIIDTGVHKLDTLFQELPLWKFVLWGVIINPFLEELIFRLCLRFNPRDLTTYSILPVSVIGNQNIAKVEKYLSRLWAGKFALIFFSSALLFAYFHLSNYELTNTVLLLSPLLIAPQLITGLFLGYLRIKYNLMLGYFMHAIHNAFFILLAFITMDLG